MKLPRGKQKGIKGAAVNVPADLGPACKLLPRLPPDAHIISLKLKRKLEYRQAYLHDTIRPEKVITALHYLKNNNPLYTDIEINEDWIRTWEGEDNDLYNGLFLNEDHNAISVSDMNSSDCDSNESETGARKENNTDEIEKEDLIALEENCKLRDLPYDTL